MHGSDEAVLSGAKILVTGATGRVAGPVAHRLAVDNEVWCLARFGNAQARADLEAAGMRTATWDMVDGDLGGVPTDFTHVMHAAVLAEYSDFERAIDITTRSVGQLMMHCRAARSFLFISTSAVYARLDAGHLHAETDPLGGTSSAVWGQAYAATKISAEGAVRAMASATGVPSVIARLSVQFGGDSGPRSGRGGMFGRFLRMMQAGEPIPVRPNGDDYCSPLHIDDIVRQVPLLWRVASEPVTVVNWGGDEAVALREVLDHMAAATGLELHRERSDSAAGMVAVDATRRTQLIGECRVPWKAGLDRLIADAGVITDVNATKSGQG